MVWAAVVYSGSASLLSYWVGRSLIGRNAERYAREADMRFSLVRVNEHIDAITLSGGEADEERRIEIDLAAVLAATAAARHRAHQSHLGHRPATAGSRWSRRYWPRRRCILRAISPSAD